jgi:predicted permease
MARVERLPGVRHVSLCALSLLDGGDRAVGVEVSGFTPRERRDNVIRMNQVTPSYFRTFGIAVLEGRGFTDADNEGAPRVALFNEAAARFYFGDRSPLGAQIRFFHDPREKEPPPYEIVGVVKDSRYQNLREPDTRLIYLPVAQERDRLEELTLAVRAEREPTGLIGAISSEVRRAGSDILLTNIATLNEQIDQSLVQERLVATLSLFFGLLSLLLACIGLYGVMSYDVARRTHELGVRMALGAQRSDVISMVLRESMLLVVIGALIGLGAALAATRLISSLLYGLSPTDPLTIGLAALLMLAVAALASYLPARRASQVDPMAALRME